jgi:hypothetical protein
MNIFYLHNDPETCAIEHVDKHVVKMILEYAQLLSTAHRVLDGTEYTDYTKNNRKIKRWRMQKDSMERVLYKATHVNHPSAVWCRQSADNYKWLYDLWRELMKEYTFRYGKHHECEKLISVLENVPKNIGDGGFTEPTPAMPDDYIIENDSIASYHKYYKQDKKRMFSWKNREVPAWI